MAKRTKKPLRTKARKRESIGALLSSLEALKPEEQFQKLQAYEFDDGEDSDAKVPDEVVEELLGEAQATKDPIWNSVLQDCMRASPMLFAAEVLQGPPQAPYNGKFIIAKHHQEWDGIIASRKRICILAARDHGKTFAFDFAYPIWKVFYNPNSKGYIFSATQDQAVRILEDIKEEIESNPLLQWLVPKIKKQWSKTSITLANGAKIYARGYGTKIRGAHPDWIVVDDGLNDEDAYSEVVRRKHIDYFYNAITNMVVPGGQIIVVGTPFHVADLYGDLAKNPKYFFKKFPALNSEGKALWPERYCATDEEQKRLEALGVIVESLESRKIEVGSVRFAREQLCEPISDDMSLFPDHLFRGEPTEQFTVKLGMPASYWDSIGVHSRFIGVDFAISSSTSADYTVVFVMGMDNHGNRWVIDILRAKGLAYHLQLSLIKAAHKKYDPDLIFLEANQMQRIFGDELIRTSDLPIHKFTTSGNKKYNPNEIPKGNTSTTNKNSLEGGVPALRVLLENGKFRIPRGDARSVEITEQWIEEMRNFTFLDGKLQGVGAHDDIVMACWICDQACRRGGFSFSDGSEDEYGAEAMQEVMQDQMEERPPEEQKELDPVIAAILAEHSDESGKSSGNLIDEDLEYGSLDDPLALASSIGWNGSVGYGNFEGH